MSSSERPLIAFISATSAAIGPATQAFADAYPEARIWNILDDRLLQDADERGGLTPDLVERMNRLIQHAKTEGADGILLTCSLYGAVVSTARVGLGLPILPADDTAFDAVIADGRRRIALISSGDGPLRDSVVRFAAAVAAADADVTADGVLAVEAFAAARSGDVERLVGALADALGDTTGLDGILLGQYSLAPAAERLSEVTGLPVYSGPQRAAEELKQLVTNGARS